MSKKPKFDPDAPSGQHEDKTAPNVAPDIAPELPPHEMTSTVQNASHAHPVPLPGLLGVKPVRTGRIGEPGYAEALAKRLIKAGFSAKSFPNAKPIGDDLEYTAPIAEFRRINEALGQDWTDGKRS